MLEFRYIFIPLVALISAQVIKFLIESIRDHQLCWGRLLNGCGGMPSSHTSFAFSLTMAIGLGEGFNSPIYAVSLVFSLIVAYDAMGLRKESGNQAVMINRILDELIKSDRRSAFLKLKEQLGHNPSEVVMGILYGSLVAWVLMSIL